MVFEALTVLCTALFSGAAVYITFVEHPARLACGTAVALSQWRPSYKRAAFMQAPLASLGFLSGVAAYIRGSGPVPLIAGVLLGALVPFTVFIILPTNKQLLDPDRDPSSDQTAHLLRRWGHLHAIRTAVSLLALLMLVVSMLIGRTG